MTGLESVKLLVPLINQTLSHYANDNYDSFPFSVYFEIHLRFERKNADVCKMLMKEKRHPKIDRGRKFPYNNFFLKNRGLH